MGEAIKIPTQYQVSISSPKGPERFNVSTENVLGGKTRYCDVKGDNEVLRNLNAVRKIALWIAGLKREYQLSDIGPYIELARNPIEKIYDEETGKELLPEEYLIMQKKAEDICMTAVGLEPENPVDRERFIDLFQTGCAAHDAATNDLRKRLAPALTDREYRGTEMMQEVKYADHPLTLIENIFQRESPQRSYEATRKFIAALRAIPGLMEQNEFKGAGSEIFALLRKKGVISSDIEMLREVVAKVYEDNGQAVSWEEYDKKKHHKLRKGEDDVYTGGSISTKQKRPWKEMFFTFPSRTTRNGFPVFFTDRDKKAESSITLKTMRKLEAPEDNLAIRVVVDETQGLDTTTQLFLLYQDMVTAFEQEGYSVEVSTKSGYMNTLTDTFPIVIGGRRVEMPAMIFDGKNNPAASPDRRVLQTDWKVVHKSGKTMRFELQTMDTLGTINRSVNGDWSDDVYKVTQMFKPLKGNSNVNIASTFFPKFIYGLDVNQYEPLLKEFALQHSLNTPSKNRLPDA